MNAIDILNYDVEVGRILRFSSVNCLLYFEKKEFDNNTLIKHTKFVYDGNNVVAEYEDNTLSKKYLWGEDVSGSMAGAGGVGALLVVNDTTEDYYSMYDGNGNIVKYVDETSNLVASFEYTPFGALKSESGSMVDELHYRFSTKYFDNNTNLIVYRYRNYNPQTGKWLKRDPIEEQGGYNLYGFVGNNPIDYIDLLGLYPSPNNPPAPKGYYSYTHPTPKPVSFDIDEDNCIVTLKIKFYITFTFKGKENTKVFFKKKLKEEIEKAFNGTRFKIKPKNKENDGDNCCPCSNGFSPKVEISYGTYTDYNFKIIVKDGVGNRSNYVKGTAAYLAVGSIYPNNKGGTTAQIPAVHEFGHLLGLQHPGYRWYKPWNYNEDTEYNHIGKDHKGRAVNGPDDLMGAGMGIRPFYFEKWQNELNKTYKDCGYETK
ncbi:RHS repeat-associated core domain-containing protein [Lentisphaerota bacterium WC36G]|nr:hypothetical protein LJT99_02690 [Lentisphaerae bacterium WC36]